MSLRRTSSDELIDNVEAAVRWAGMPNTRVKPLLQHLCGALARRHRRPARDTILIIEASTIADVHFLWDSRHADYEGLLPKVKASVVSGPELPDDEVKGKAHSGARNDRFVYFLAGCLLQGGASIPSVDGIARRRHRQASLADIVIEWNQRQVPIECKRPFDLSTLVSNIKRAGKDIRNHSREKGVVAVDCSRLVRPKDSVPIRFGEEDALSAVERRLDRLVTEHILKRPSRHMTGVLAFARVPTFLFTGVSPVLTLSGEPHLHALSVTADSWMTRKREGVENADVVDAIASALKWVEG